MRQPGLAEQAHQEVVRLAHRGLDLFTFLQRTEDQLRRVTDFRGAACFFTIDPATLLLTGHINKDLVENDERRRSVNSGVANNEYRENDYNKFASLARSRSPAGSLAEAAAGRPERSPRYRQLMRPFGLEGELRAAFVADGACWGGAALFRTADQPGFNEADGRFLAGVSRHIAEGIRTALVLRAMEESEAPGAPGLILLDERGRVEALNQMATHWLGQLIDPGEPNLETVPQVVYGVAEQAQLAGASGAGTHGPVRARVPTRTGRWLIIHGTLLEGRRKGSAVIIEPARPPEIAPLLLEAYGLSEREQTVTLCVLQGLSTVEIARRLFISPYTVQDHLKSVFEKMGVRSRRELVARVFFDHYFPRLQEQDPVASSEWFEGMKSLATAD